jgi:antitoxin component of MazEF toxin-antitoxin module
VDVQYNVRHTSLMAVQRQVKKIGGSLGVLIPRDIAEAMGVEEGSDVLLTLVNRQLVVEPTVDSIDGATFQRAFAAVLRRDGDGFQWLADFDRGLTHGSPAPTAAPRTPSRRRAR